jgi:acyl carrier protein
MVETEERLLKCFSAAFPTLNSQQLRSASVDTVATWDSVASVTLLATIEEEFAIEVDIDDMAGLVSFDKILNYLQSETTS